jgi:hypothetical protein
VGDPLQLFYQFALMGIYLLALSDWASRSRAARNRKVFARTRPWLSAHFLFHFVVLIWFAASWPGPIRAIALFYTMNAMAMLWVVPAGATWGLLAGSPAPLACCADLKSRRQALIRLLEFSGLAMISLLLSALPILFVKWETHPELDSRMPDTGSQAITMLFLGYLLVSAPFAEEPIFRQYLLCRLIAFFRKHLTLRRKTIGPAFRKTSSVLFALSVTTILFAAGHMHMIEPAWIKWYQISILGVALGICQLRFGLLAAVGLHFVLNAGSLIMALVQRKS